MVLVSFAPDLPDPAFLARSALRERFEDELRVEIGECDGLRFSLDEYVAISVSSPALT